MVFSLLGECHRDVKNERLRCVDKQGSCFSDRVVAGCWESGKVPRPTGKKRHRMLSLAGRQARLFGSSGSPSSPVSRRGLRSLRAGGLADDKKEVKMTGLETDPAVDGLDA